MNVTLLKPENLMWPMGMQDNTPYYRCGSGSYQRSMKVDAYPCYAHDFDLVQSLADLCEARFPLRKAKTGIWILSHDFIDRVNGVTYEDSIYRKDDGSEWDETLPCQCGDEKCKAVKHFNSGQALTIVLSGKRVPIHPAMTRYLVTHEYGHAVFDYATRQLGYDHNDGREKLLKKYMEIRGLSDYTLDYNGGQWHRTPHEIIANDFRILFCKQELEFWPHDCSLPNWHEPEGKWWKETAEACGVKVK